MIFGSVPARPDDVDEQAGKPYVLDPRAHRRRDEHRCLAVGVGLAFVDVHIGWVAAAIGLATFMMVSVGVMLGRALGAIAGRRAEILGGLLLIGIGAAIVYEHVGAAP